jgi:hypothetical protein
VVERLPCDHDALGSNLDIKKKKLTIGKELLKCQENINVKVGRSREWWLVPVILATQEADIERTAVQG